MAMLIAHRGASVEAPENTLVAIKRAIALQVDCIEMDLRLTKDGIPVVIHDSSLHRTTNAARRGVCVEDLTLEEVKQLDAGSWFSQDFAGEQIPTLQEVLALDRKGSSLMLEIKKGMWATEKVVAKIIAELPSADPTIYLGSFEPRIIQALQKTSFPLIGIAEKPEFIQPFLEMGIVHLALWFRLLESQLFTKLKDKGVMVWAFTVDDPSTAKHLHKLGVDGIITNHPRLMQEALPTQPKA